MAQQQLERPILDQLVRQAARSRLPLHVPGHKQGRSLPGPFAAWLGAAAKIDLTELPGLDNLHHPTGCIAASQQLAASHYGSDVCLYSVNGSTAGIMAALMGTVPHGGKVLLLNPVHQSAWRGLILGDLVPVFADVIMDERRHTAAAPTASAAQQALAADPGIRAVYVTSPTYTGEVAPVADIVAIAHRHGVPVIVDEAHGAHFGLSPRLPMHSIEAGADVVIHSVHKMLPGLTQTAWVHCTGPRVDAQRVADALRLLQTSSPSYLLLASIDAAQAWLRLEGPAAAEELLHALALLTPLREGDTSSAYDPFRHWLPVGSEQAGAALQEWLAAKGMFVEYADPSGVLSLFGFGHRERDVAQYVNHVQAWLRSSAPWQQTDSALWAYTPRPVLLATPRAVHEARSEIVPLAEATGRISAALVTPYPPGVPVLWPGQRIDTDLCERLRTWSQARHEVQGLTSGPGVRVLAEIN